MLPQDRPTGTALLRLWARPDLGAGERVGISQEVFDRYRAVVGHLAGNDRLTRYEALGADHHARAPDVAQRSVRL